MTVRAKDETAAVLKWRKGELMRMGCSLELADTLASLKGLDLDSFRRLRAKGCDPTTAARILNPDDLEFVVSEE